MLLAVFLVKVLTKTDGSYFNLVTHYFTGEVPGDVRVRHPINVVSLKERHAVAIV